MSTSHRGTDRSTGTRTPNPTQHSRELALDDREYQLLLEGADRMRDYYGQQARFIILVGGRLGLRAGEIAHMQADWIDYRRRMICIPRFERCQKGQDGGVCGYCRSCAEQKVDWNDDLTLDEALAGSWSPKTPAAAREVPFDFDARVELVIERFFDRYDEFPTSRQSVNRRVDKAAEHAEELDVDDVTPHGLRATAATHHAARGLDVLPLQSMFGWADLSTARKYVATSGENTQRALHMVHSR